MSERNLSFVLPRGVTRKIWYQGRLHEISDCFFGETGLFYLTIEVPAHEGTLEVILGKDDSWYPDTEIIRGLIEEIKLKELELKSCQSQLDEALETHKKHYPESFS